MLQAPAAPLPLCTAPVLSILSFPGGRGSRGAVCLLSPWEQRRWLSLTGNVERLSAMYPKVSKAQNAELWLRWCQIVLRNNHEPEYSKVKAFLHSQVCAGGGWQRGGGVSAPPALCWGCSAGLRPNHRCAGQGKQKYTLPLYRAMWGGSEAARALAMETFSATAPQLHINVRNYVKKILGLEGSD